MRTVLSIMLILMIASAAPAVTSKIVRHKNSGDMAAGKTDNVIISSRPSIQLGREAEELAGDFNDAWVINTIVAADDGTIYLGTSPNGSIFKYKGGKLTKIYPLDVENDEEVEVDEPADSNDPNVISETEIQKHLSNRHIFAMAAESKGRLLAGVSGQDCQLLRFKGADSEVIFEPNDASYIFAIALDEKKDIYLATGPGGKIYRLNASGKNAEVIHECEDKNILSLAVGEDGSVYAGTDTRGLVYKIDPKTKQASVLYDTEQDEITSLLFDKAGNLYAAATSDRAIGAQTQPGSPPPKTPLPGRPEPKEQKPEEGGQLSLTIPNMKNQEDKKPTGPPPARMERGLSKGAASRVYKINKEGFVTEVFNEVAVFFSLEMQQGQLLLGTGNKAQLFSINPETEIETIIYEDKTASQITDMIVKEDEIYLSTANPAKLIKLSSDFASKGEYESVLIDAGQPARWGKLQIDSDIPKGTKVLISARSGNVGDVNDPTYSAWTKPVKIVEPVELSVGTGRFCQYKLILESGGKTTPRIREVAVAYVIPNLPPKVTQVNVKRNDKSSIAGIFDISYTAQDENGDNLTYRIDFRKMPRTGWIELKDELTEPSLEWNSNTIEDGIYEVKVTASDVAGNTKTTELTGTRISEPVVIDNSAPVIKNHTIKTDKDVAILTLNVDDEYSVIDNLSYTLDSNDKWNSALPEDNIYDTTNEDFTIIIKELTSGDHVIAVKISDAEGNTMYKTFDVFVK